MLLAIDTATRVMSAALHDKNSVLAEYTVRAGNQHTTLLAPLIQSLLEACDVSPADLTGLAVAVGPGSYTGLRIGVALAKGIAAARGLPLVGVSTPDIVAAAQPLYNTRYGLIAVVQAGRGRIITQAYRWSKGHWIARGGAAITDWETLLAGIEGYIYIAGEVDTSGAAAIAAAQQNGTNVVLAPAAYRLRRAGFLAEEALRRMEREPDNPFPPDRVMPVYLKTESAP